MSRKELDRLNEKPKSWDQLYDEQLARWQPTIKKYKTAVVPSREEWIAKQTQEEATSQGMLVAQERAGSSWDPEKYNAPETLARWKAYTGPLRASGYTAWFNAGCPESPPEDISGGIS